MRLLVKHFIETHNREELKDNNINIDYLHMLLDQEQQAKLKKREQKAQSKAPSNVAENAPLDQH